MFQKLKNYILDQAIKKKMKKKVQITIGVIKMVPENVLQMPDQLILLLMQNSKNLLDTMIMNMMLAQNKIQVKVLLLDMIKEFMKKWVNSLHGLVVPILKQQILIQQRVSHLILLQDQFSVEILKFLNGISVKSQIKQHLQELQVFYLQLG